MLPDRVDKRLGRDVDPQIDHVVTGGNQGAADDVLAQVMHVPLDRTDDDLVPHTS